METQQYFDTLAYEGEVEQSVLNEIFQAFNGLRVDFVSREEFQEQQGSFLKQDEQGREYVCIPEDLRIDELPAIIRRINRETFGDELPEYASVRELQTKIVVIVDELLTRLGSGEDTQRALKKYYLLYGDLTSPEEANRLGDNEYRREIINKNQSEEYSEFQQQLRETFKNQTREQLSYLADEIMAREVESHFEESVFERGIQRLRLGMTMLTLQEAQDIGVEKVDLSSFPDQEILLRDMIDIDGLKEELVRVRASGNENEIQEMELRAANQVAAQLYRIPYQFTDAGHGDKPYNILQTKEVFCVGFSLLGHTFLSELGIDHRGIDIPGHSVLEVTIGGQSYMLDATGWDTIVPIDYREQIGDTTRMVIEGYGEKYVRVSDAEQMLISQIYHNVALNGDSPSSKLVLLDKALAHTPNYTDIHFSRGLAYYNLDRYEEAMQSFIKALEKDPRDIDSYAYLARTLLELGRPEEAYQVIETILADQPSNVDLLATKAELLLELGHNQEAVDLMARVLRVNPGNLTILLRAGSFLGHSGREDLGYVFFYVFDKVTGRQSNYPIDEHYKNTIDTLYDEGDVYASGEYLADLLVSS